MITFESSGSFKNMESFLENVTKRPFKQRLAKYGQMGVDALAAATPAESGVTAASWYYEIQESKGSISLIWSNSHSADGVPVVILLQYGHGTGTGGYVRGRDFINPAIKPIFDQIADAMWKEVTSA